MVKKRYRVKKGTTLKKGVKKDTPGVYSRKTKKFKKSVRKYRKSPKILQKFLKFENTPNLGDLN